MTPSTKNGSHSASPVRFAFLSDIHLAPLPPFDWPHWNVKRALGYVNWQRKRRFIHDRDALDLLVLHLKAQKPDHVLVGGDLANLGFTAEYEAALAWLLELGPADRVSVVPGNHDIYTTLWTEPGVARWQAYMLGDDRWSPQNAPHSGPAFPYFRQIGPVAVIALNSAHPTAPGSARGRIGDTQLKDLIDLLHQAESEGLFRLVLLHHPPLPGQAPWRRGLADASALSDVLSTYGAELVLHGHNHLLEMTWAETRHGSIPILGAGSASAIVRHHGAPLASYRMIEIGGDAASGWSITNHSFGLTPDVPEVVALESWTSATPRPPATV